MKFDMTQIREALEASWDEETAYQGISAKNNTALGQCYPTSRVMQFFFPDIEIVEGVVWTGSSTEKHFWNLLKNNGAYYHIDFTWQQFPRRSVIRHWEIRDRRTLNDSWKTISRVNVLHDRVKKYLSAHIQKVET